MKNIYKILSVLTLGLTSAFAIRKISAASQAVRTNSYKSLDHIRKAALEHFSKVLQFETVSYHEKEKIDFPKFIELRKYLFKSYPLIESKLEKDVVNEHSLLYTWKGKNPKLKPILLMAHMDVVPVDKSTLHQWKHKPFSGALASGYVWGRGALDMKVALVSIFEAVEELLRTGFEPERSILLAFGHDEEVGGKGGAEQIAKVIKEKGLEPEFVFDEGLAITEKVVPNTHKPIAMIGIAEKGSVYYELSVKVQDGHSSMPPKQTAIGVLAEAIHKLQKNPLQARITFPVEKFLEYIAPSTSVLPKFLFKNQKLFDKLILNSFSKTASGNALVRTTMAPTVLKSGFRENIMPSEGSVILNYRMLPGDDVESVRRYIEDVIDNKNISIQIKDSWRDNPSPIANIENEGWDAIYETISELFPEAVIAPSLTLAGTDSRKYLEFTSDVYRFLPLRMKPKDLDRVHGINERISQDNYMEMIVYYMTLVHKMCGKKGQNKFLDIEKVTNTERAMTQDV
ncbi:M20/M25/M40 family metallo-hydrolase [Sediminitomix flava]|uniref:Carboxypeptidase PM20D1 n=1 Tax=Sediminitomix flava TaxID=379075 RepID=A0A315ZH52_SEDFL|nr:M20/M25/M40 family metallo-hydrolase [Sediminitomix flava]PWJ44935.1 carboxypeptidase PM20D1 [Sediminitomix flava]